MKYEPKTLPVQREGVTKFFAATKSGGAQWWTDEVSAAVVADLAHCEACLAEAERERDQAWNDAERLRGVMMKYDVSKKEQRDKRWDDMTKRAELNGRSIIEGYYEMNLYAIAKSAEEELATLTQERDALKRIIDDTLREVPVGNVNAHIPENLPRDMEYYFEIERLEKERDALREVTRALIRAGDALYVKGKFADPDYWAPCNWATVVEESAKLLTPSGEAGKGGGV